MVNIRRRSLSKHRSKFVEFGKPSMPYHKPFFEHEICEFSQLEQRRGGNNCGGISIVFGKFLINKFSSSLHDLHSVDISIILYHKFNLYRLKINYRFVKDLSICSIGLKAAPPRYRIEIININQIIVASTSFFCSGSNPYMKMNGKYQF